MSTTPLRKLLICPWFGPLPEWMPLWEANIARLEQFGFDVLRWDDLEAFKERVREILGIECPIVPGEGKIHDYRCAFGLLFPDEIRGYDFWGHTDFDCVYGRVENWVTDEFLSGLDVHSNHSTYICGPWTLYRNRPDINALFQREQAWKAILEEKRASGWVEFEFSRLVDSADVAGRLRRTYTYWQTQNLNSFHSLYFDGDRLLEYNEEIMMAHFRRTKEYPKGCIR